LLAGSLLVFCSGSRELVSLPAMRCDARVASLGTVLFIACSASCAHTSKMGKFDDCIEWLQVQKENAQEALADLKGGHKLVFNDEDVTDEWVSRYELMVGGFKQLIDAYERRNE
jgi:hypothetical protein